MKTLSTHEAKANLSSILKEIGSKGSSFVICKNGHPIATLQPYVKPDRSSVHPIMSDISIQYDPTESLTEDEWPSQI